MLDKYWLIWAQQTEIRLQDSALSAESLSLESVVRWDLSYRRHWGLKNNRQDNFFSIPWCSHWHFSHLLNRKWVICYCVLYFFSCGVCPLLPAGTSLLSHFLSCFFFFFFLSYIPFPGPLLSLWLPCCWWYHTFALNRGNLSSGDAVSFCWASGGHMIHWLQPCLSWVTSLLFAPLEVTLGIKISLNCCCTNGCHSFSKVLAPVQASLLCKFFHLWPQIFNRPFIIISLFTLTQVGMFWDFKAHTEAKTQCVAGMMFFLFFFKAHFLSKHPYVRTQPRRLQPRTTLVWKNSCSIQVNSPWLDLLVTSPHTDPEGVLNAKVIVFSEATWSNEKFIICRGQCSFLSSVLLSWCTSWLMVDEGGFRTHNWVVVLLGFFIVENIFSATTLTLLHFVVLVCRLYCSYSNTCMCWFVRFSIRMFRWSLDTLRPDQGRTAEVIRVWQLFLVSCWCLDADVATKLMGKKTPHTSMALLCSVSTGHQATSTFSNTASCRACMCVNGHNGDDVFRESCGRVACVMWFIILLLFFLVCE